MCVSVCVWQTDGVQSCWSLLLKLKQLIVDFFVDYHFFLFSLILFSYFLFKYCD